MENRMEEKETGRLESFSDGVIAVAITLLVLDLQPPAHISGDPDLLLWLGGQWANYLAFVTSFATIGVMWMNHHRMFTFIKRTDAILMLLNLLLLLFIVIVPFPTALVAQSLKVPGSRVAALLYNGTYVLLAICFNVLLRYATHENRLLGKQIDRDGVHAMLRQYRFGPGAYIITFVVTWINVPLSLILNLLMAVFWALPARKPRSQTVSSTLTASDETAPLEQTGTSRADD
jgi:uncharacterized membrane protein